MKRPGATLDAGCVIAKLHLDDPSRVQQVSRRFNGFFPGKHALASCTHVVLVVQWLSVGLVIERSLAPLVAGALSSQLGSTQPSIPAG